MVGFIFGGDTGQTQESLTDARRRMAVAMLQQGMDSSPIRSPWQGAARMAEALVGGLQFRNMQSQQNDTHNQLMAALTGQPYTPQAQSGGLLSSIFGGGNSSGASAQNPAQDRMVQDASGQPIASNATPSSIGTPSSAGGNPAYRDAIASIESKGSGDYGAVGPTSPSMGRALGRYQIMEANIAPWSQEALGRAVTPDEFLANPHIQDAIFDKKFGGYVNQFGPSGAAQAWFAGPGGVGKLNRQDSLGTSVGTYANKFNAALGAPQSQAPVPNAPVQTASLDPSTGMKQAYAPPQQSSGGAQAINQIAPAGANPAQQPAMGNVGIGQVPAGSGGQPVLDVTQVPQLSSAAGLPFANGGSPAGAAPQASAAPMSPQQNLADALMQKNDTALGGIMAPAGTPQPASAQGGGNFPPAPSAQGGQQAVAQAMSGLPPQLASNPKAMALLSVVTNPNASAGDRSVAGMILQQQMTPQYDFITRPDGSVVAVNKLNPAMSQQVQGAMKTDSIVDGPIDPTTGLPSKLVWNPVDGVKGRLGPDGSIQPAGQAQPQQAPQPGAIPAPPPGVDPKKYREEAGSRSAADALPSAKDEFGFAKDLTDRPSYKEYAAAVPTWNSFTKHIQDNTPAADKAIVDDFAKILNPGRSVNTGAFLLNMDAQSIPALLQGQLAKAWSGEGELGPDARAQMAQIARLKVEQYRNAWGLDAQQSAEIAKAHHMNSDLIIPKIPDLEDIDFSKINSTTTTRNGLNGGQPAQGSPVQIKSVDDYNNLKSGTEYIDPNGNRRTKN